ncbi:DNA internalization-related competence protein ComEC/Rec2 [Chryseomicrobium excrementi]|uniref:DNA internalization-related competence protein ComEC/Rec2 n=1 Tax=Chryseomicrobium excrementi TaxID=2041346 RepID=A0A2M9F243_9BACL|nr:DNA internalization-related competence protein ComEC/Rec2 [Chryseomicrobium excrementi]
MPYLVIAKKLQNNWIYLAGAAIFGCFSAWNSLFYFLGVIGISLFCNWRVSKTVALLTFAIGVGFYSYSLFRVPEPLEDVSRIQATMTEHMKLDGDRLTAFVLTETGARAFISYKIESEQQVKEFAEQNWTGRKLELEVALPEPRQSSHPFEFSFKTYLFSKGAGGSYEVSSVRVEGEAGGPLWTLRKWMSSLRQHIHEQVVQKVPLSLQDEFLALTIGDRTLADDDSQRLYQKLGISHLFAISGLHVALLTGVIYKILLLLSFRRLHIYVSVLALVPFYMFLAGGAPSIVRASLLIFVATLLVIFKIKIPPSDLLAGVFLLTLLYFPFYLLQPGYQLSFLAVTSFVFSTKLLRHNSFWLSAFFTTVVCQLAVLPVILYHFQQLSIISLPLNVVAIPLFTFVIMPFSFFYTGLALLPFEQLPLISNYGSFRGLIQFLFELSANLPFAVWTPPSTRSIFLITVVFVCVIFYVAEKRVFLALALFLVGCALWQLLPQLNEQAKISFLYVGQGDSTVIEFPYKEQVVVIDTGGVATFSKEPWQKRNGYEVGRSIVTPYLRSKGISTIDVLMLTHADADHTEGAEEVLEEFEVRQLIIPQGILKLEELQDVIEVAKKKEIPVHELIAPLELSSTSMRVVLLPVPGVYQGNDSSIVTVAEVYGTKVVLSGDLEMEGEGKMLRQYGGYLKTSDVIKLGHHGSKTSSTEQWLDTINPEVAIGSAGENNRYGHPHTIILERLKAKDIPYLGTHELGTIELLIDSSGTRTFKTLE